MVHVSVYVHEDKVVLRDACGGMVAPGDGVTAWLTDWAAAKCGGASPECEVAFGSCWSERVCRFCLVVVGAL